MSQINEPNGYETEGSSALKSTANTAGGEGETQPGEVDYGEYITEF